MNLEVRWVEDLLTLERERSISKAAEKRFISQSAFTRRIQQIEEMIELKLLFEIIKIILNLQTLDGLCW